MTLLKVMLFSLAVLLSYTLFANIVPQIQSNPPTDETPEATDKLDAAGMVAWGEKLFAGKGTCTLCHNKLGRAPDLLALDLAEVLPARIRDPRYKGKAKDKTDAGGIEIYLRESMVDPSVYVVAGFGKKGTNDAVSPMRPVNAPPISLTDTEIDAVIAFLQEKAGVKVTVPLPKDKDKPTPVAKTEDDDEDEDDDEPAKTAEAALKKYNCVTCHDLFGSEADAGPKLFGIGKRLGRDGLREAILDPNATITKGFDRDIMPKDYAEQMRISELNLIVDYLLTFGGEAQKK